MVARSTLFVLGSKSQGLKWQLTHSEDSWQGRLECQPCSTHELACDPQKKSAAHATVQLTPVMVPYACRQLNYKCTFNCIQKEAQQLGNKIEQRDKLFRLTRRQPQAPASRKLVLPVATMSWLTYQATWIGGLRPVRHSARA